MSNQAPSAPGPSARPSGRSPARVLLLALLVLCCAGACHARLTPMRALAMRGTFALLGVDNPAVESLAVQSSTPAQPEPTTCCINGAFFDCPDTDAGMRCSGNTSACVSKCFLSSDMDCPARCLEQYPPDPSRCTRNPSQDTSCT